MTKYFKHNGCEFETLDAYKDIPDTKYGYVCCVFYNKATNHKLYIREDMSLFKHKVMRCDAVNGFVSVKEIQKHPVNEKLIHVDFYIIDQASNNFRIRLPIKFQNMDKSQGIKLGGFLNITSRDLEVKVGSMADLTPYLSVDMTGYEQEQSVTLGNIMFSSNISPIRKSMTVATVMPSKGGE
jgi:Ribosomal protein TL5, C-terminal domain/Ribosomal L25p family